MHNANTQLLLIDPQYDFCHPNGALYVPGAEHDMARLADFIQQVESQLSKIYVSLDTHRKLDIAHPLWWQDKAGKHPEPFTIITSAAVKDKQWITTISEHYDRSLDYLVALDEKKRYPHTIWPEHCLIGSLGHTIDAKLFQALSVYEQKYLPVEIIIKGRDPWTEHFSAICAEVPDQSCPETLVNYHLVKQLEQADTILIAGEAATHCVLNTVLDLVTYFSDKQHINKLIWLTDGSSSVPNPPNTQIFSEFLTENLAKLQALGMRCMSMSEYLNSIS